MLRVLDPKLPNLMTMKTRQKLLLCTAAAAFSSSAQAWMIHQPIISSARHRSHYDPLRVNVISRASGESSSLPWAATSTPLRTPSSRLYSNNNGSNNNNYSNNKDDDGNFLTKIGKTILPKKWGTKLFGTDDEKAQLARKEQVRQDVSSSLDTMLKDAPLGVKMLGKMVSPIMSKVASSMAETMAEQARTTEMLLEDAREFMLNDSNVREVLGTPLSVGAPFQQSSSTMSVNGQTQTRTELAFPVNGSRGDGVARLLASNDGISQLLVEANGRLMEVHNLSKGRSQFAASSSSSSSSDFNSRRRYDNDNDDNDDGVIEAEIIEKTPKKW